MLDVQGNEPVGAKIFSLEVARESRRFTDALLPFLSCEINQESADALLDILANNNRLYFFDDDATQATVLIDGEDEALFSHREGLMVNVVMMRFQEDQELYLSMLRQVFGDDKPLALAS